MRRVRHEGVRSFTRVRVAKLLDFCPAGGGVRFSAGSWIS